MAKKPVKKAAKKVPVKKKKVAAKSGAVKPAGLKKKVKKKVLKKKVVKKGTAAKGPSTDKKTSPVVKKKVVKRSGPKEVRMKAYWGVFSQTLRRVALFEFSERKKAEQKAEELSKSSKSPHFIQPVKEQIIGE